MEIGDSTEQPVFQRVCRVVAGGGGTVKRNSAYSERNNSIKKVKNRRNILKQEEKKKRELMEKCHLVDIGGWYVVHKLRDSIQIETWEEEHPDVGSGRWRIWWWTPREILFRVLSMWRVSIGKEVLTQEDKVFNTFCRNQKNE